MKTLRNIVCLAILLLCICMVGCNNNSKTSKTNSSKNSHQGTTNKKVKDSKKVLSNKDKNKSQDKSNVKTTKDNDALTAKQASCNHKWIPYGHTENFGSPYESVNSMSEIENGDFRCDLCGKYFPKGNKKYQSYDLIRHLDECVGAPEYNLIDVEFWDSLELEISDKDALAYFSYIKQNSGDVVVNVEDGVQCSKCGLIKEYDLIR